MMNPLFLLLLFSPLAYFSPEGVAAEDMSGGKDLVIGRMKVTLMPEYDSPQVLAIYEGKFKDKDAFPTEALFLLPREVTRLTDVCSLSPGGQHFCQLYEIKRKAEWSETLVKLPYSDFFVDFQYAPFQPKAVESRKFSFDLRLPYAVEILEIHIQQPFRATGFAVTPPSSDIYEKKDFTYYRYDMKDQEKGKTLRFDITYGKVDAKPSVDVKFSPMSQPELMEEKRGIFLLVVGGIFLAVLASASFIRSRKGGENS